MAAPSSRRRKHKACMPAGARPSPSVSRVALRTACHVRLRALRSVKPPIWCYPMPISRAQGWKIALSLPGTEEVLWFNKPAVFIHDQFLTKVHDKEEAMTFRVSSMEIRDMMLEAEPTLFYITDHYRNFPFVLARLSVLTPKILKEMVAGRAAQLAESKDKVRPRKKPLKKLSAKKTIAPKRAKKIKR